MKKRIRLLAAILAATLTMSIAFCAYASFTTGTIFRSGKYYHQDKFKDYKIAQGIDVSNHNGDVDWAKVKAAGVEFAIIRIGCRGYGSGGTLLEDTKYKEYFEGARKQGLAIGVYFYSQALNTKEAKAEAEFVMKRIEPYRDDITLPVYYDYEFANVSSGRLDSAWRNGTINKNMMTDNAIAFCTVAEDNGYRAGIYASEYFFYDNLNYKELQEKYSIWLAHYTDNTDYKGDFDLWQFSAKGTVSGISGYVDSNFRYYYDRFQAETLAPVAYTGQAIQPVPAVYLNGALLTKDTDYTLSYQNNKDIGTAQITVQGINQYRDIPSEVITFDIIPPKVQKLSVTKQSASGISLSWKKAAGSGGYQVWYKANGTWKKAGVTSGTEYTVSGLDGATTYIFKVRAFKRLPTGVCFGDYSAKKTTFTTPKKVTGITDTAVNSTSITLKWDKQPLATGYAIYQYNTETKKYDYLKSVSGTKNTYKRSGLTAGTAYDFKIKAMIKLEDGTVYKGALSNAYRAYTSPAAPTVKSVKSADTKVITVNWKQTKGATGYEVMWSTAKDFSHNFKYVTVASGNSTATLNTAQSGITYYVRMRSYKTYNGVRHYSSWSKTYSVIAY